MENLCIFTSLSQSKSCFSSIIYFFSKNLDSVLIVVFRSRIALTRLECSVLSLHRIKLFSVQEVDDERVLKTARNNILI